MLEPYDGKLSRTVLRGERGGNAPDLLGLDRDMIKQTTGADSPTFYWMAT